MKNAEKLVFFFVLFILFSGNLPGICEETGRPASVTGRPQGTEHETESHVNVGVWFAGVFRDHISRVDGDR